MSVDCGEGMSLRTAFKSQRSQEEAEKSAKKLCIGGADRGTSLRSALKSQTGKPVRNVTMGPQEVIDLDESEYWQLRICVDCHIVLSFQAVNLSSIEAEGRCSNVAEMW